MLQKLLVQTPHISQWGTCILQPQMVGFNSSYPIGMKLPMQITVRAVPDKLVSSAWDIAQCLRTVLSRDKGNRFEVDEKFCIALTTGSPYCLTISRFNPVAGTVSYIQVDYDNLSTWCRYCLSTEHLVRDCNAIYSQKKIATTGPHPQATLTPNNNNAQERTSTPNREQHANTVVSEITPPPNVLEVAAPHRKHRRLSLSPVLEVQQEATSKIKTLRTEREMIE